MKYTKLIISVLYVITFCVGCSTSEEAITETDVPPTNIPVPPTNSPIPQTVTPITSFETPGEPAVEFPLGRLYNSSFDSTLIINDDGTWRLLEGKNRTFFTGLYQIEGDQVAFTDRSVYCVDFEDGIYSWDFSAGALRLKTVNDDCIHRTLRLSLPYTQQ